MMLSCFAVRTVVAIVGATMKRRLLLSPMYKSRRSAALVGREISSLSNLSLVISARQTTEHALERQRNHGQFRLNKRAFTTDNHALQSLISSFSINQFVPGSVSALRCFSTLESAVDTDITVRADFWGEPVTFLPSTESRATLDTDAMAAMDDFSIAIASKGSSCSGGGDDEGVPTMAAHSAGIVWAECLEQASEWHTVAPMLAVAAVGPILTQANVGYLQTLDKLLRHTESPISFVEMAKTATDMREDERLTARERAHLRALYHMLRHERRQALDVLMRLLQQAPGDALALCLAIDLANTIGDCKSALRAAGYVASYWQERGERGLRTSMPGYSLVLSWIALGFAAGGRFAEAERMAERAIYQDAKSCGAVGSWALAHVFDAEGRASEGISKLSGDGVKYYETAGLLFFDGRLASYGARFLLDREGMGEGRSPLRMYDTAFERVLRYSGYSNGRPWTTPIRRAPRGRSEKLMESVGHGAKSFFGQVFGSGKTKERTVAADEFETQPSKSSGKPTIEDVLAWMPPTPQLLTDATFLLLRLTMNESISVGDYRWAELTNAWMTMLSSQMDNENAYDDEEPSSSTLSPLATIVASIMCPPIALPHSEGRVAQISRGLSLVGELLRTELPLEAPSTNETKDKWAKVVAILSEAASTSDEFEGWDMELRPVIDQVICYAARQSKDHESLCIARSFNSLGVTLRPNCPEEWFRYSRVLEALGDDVAAEDARAASVSLGSGEGGAGAH